MASSLTDDELRKKLKSLGVDVGPITSMTRRTYQKKLDSLLKEHGAGKTPLNALSSDDSEIEQSSSGDSNRRRKRLSHNWSQSSTPSPNRYLKPTEKTKSSPVTSKDIFKKPFTRTSIANTSSGSKHSLNSSSIGGSSFEMETSDSDIDTDALWHSIRSSKKSKTYYPTEKPKQSTRLRKSFQTSTPNGGEPRNSIRSVSSLTDIKLDKQKKNILDSDYNFISKERKHTKESTLNGYARDILNGEFQSEKSRGKTTNYSHCVSWLLVLAVSGLFIILGLFYVSTIKKNQLISGKVSYLDSHFCQNSNAHDCIPQNYYKTVLSSSRELYNILSTVAGEFECESGRELRNLSTEETKKLLREHLETQTLDVSLPFEEIFKYTLILSRKIPDWGIRAYSAKGLITSDSGGEKDLREISALESIYASKSIWCRLKHSIRWTLTTLLFLSFVSVLVALSYVFLKFWRKRKEQEEKKFFGLVEQVIDILKDSNISEQPVTHIRDMMIPLKERGKKAKLWERIVTFIEDNESRVQVDTKCINGEEYKIWRWLPSPSSELETGKHGKVWQGPAFSSTNKGKNSVPYSPTPCLKIRNMFDNEVEYGDDWIIYIQDAILEKCEANRGILHIAVDQNSNEGCVYVMCDSPRSAGQVYTSLHGWWFDGKLVTVKYLRLSRYLEKFPESEGCTEPLKPSNNKRLSLSAPFFSSVLERS